MIERTLSIIKPDAVQQNLIGEIYSRFEQAGLTIKCAKSVWLDRSAAANFYREHDGKVFFEDLMQFMTSGPIFVQVLEGENAIELNRKLMGATDPQKADAGTIRADFAKSVDANAVHGSDSSKSAIREIAFFFNAEQLFDDR